MFVRGKRFPMPPCPSISEGSGSGQGEGRGGGGLETRQTNNVFLSPLLMLSLRNGICWRIGARMVKTLFLKMRFLTFDHTFVSVHLLSSRWTFVPDLKKFTAGVPTQLPLIVWVTAGFLTNSSKRTLVLRFKLVLQTRSHRKLVGKDPFLLEWACHNNDVIHLNCFCWPRQLLSMA